MRNLTRTAKLLFTCVLVAIWTIPLSVCAQPLETPAFNYLTPEDGLSQSTGKAIIQDYKGYMWIGTQDGLNKYDGHEITVYKPVEGDSNSLGYPDISCLFEDSENNLWVGTLGGGLNLYNRDRDNFTRYEVNAEHPDKGLTDYTVFTLEEDRDGSLWIGTNNGLNVRRKGENEFLHIFADSANTSSLNSNYIEYIFEDSRNNIWVGTNRGLNVYNPEKQELGSFDSYLENDHVYIIYEDRKGTLWIGTEGGGLISYDYSSDEFTRYLYNANDPYSIADNSVFSILEDSRGVMWIGTENEGLDALDRETGRFYHYKQNPNDPRSINNNAVYTLYENNDKLLWIGTFAGGINILDIKDPEFQHYKNDPYRSNSLSNNSVLSFLEDESGNFWVGTDGGAGGGLNLFDRERGTFTSFKHDPLNANSIPSDVILELILGKNGDIWMGTYQGGVSRFNYENMSFKNYRYDPGTPGGINHNDIFALYRDSEDNIWAGSNGGGVDVLRPGRDKFSQFGHDSVRVLGGEINISHVRSFYEDTLGNFWIGTYGSGIIRYNKRDKSFNSYHVDNSSISNSVILCITEDSKGRFWVGTKGGGLNLFDRTSGEFKAYTTNEGLNSNVINGVLEDSEGNLWLSTNNGISKFNPDEEVFINYGLEDGLQSREFNPGAYYKDDTGYMYFGGINGFNRFHPHNIKPDSFVHPVELTDFLIFNRSVESGPDSPLRKQISEAERIVLPHTASVLTFEYATLNYNSNKGNEYAFMLEGFDEEWNYVNERRSATYTNLDAGDYIFKVKASNSDGVWSEEAASVNITVTPPFWRTTWFYLLSAAFIGLIGFSVYRYRVRSIREQNKRLEQEVKARTSELNEKNEELRKALNDLENTREELVEKAHKAGMADIATGVLHNVGNILNSVNTSSSLIGDALQNSKIKNLKKANDLLREHLDHIERFISENPKGKKLLDYYLKLEEPLENEYKTIQKLSHRLTEKVNLIKDVIAAQQSYATAGMNNDTLALSEIIDDALMLNAVSAERHSIKVEKEFENVEPVVCQRTKLIHVLVNLLKNSKEAMQDVDEENRKITLKLTQDDKHVYLKVSDTGHGIKKENLKKVFNQGFTTKRNGHGYGLHSSANYVKDMKADIKVESKGEGEGATFTIRFRRTDA